MHAALYSSFKHAHFLFIGLSVFFLTIRFCLVMANSTFVDHKAMKAASHLSDILLLSSGVALIVITGFMPFNEGSAWLISKFTCVFAYFALGFFAIKLGKNKLLKIFAYFGALGWLVMATNVAMTKTSFL